MKSDNRRQFIARRAAQDLTDGMVVNLGIGIPTLVPAFVPADREVIYQSENGLLGLGAPPAAGAEDPDIINASKDPATLVAGAAVFDSLSAFAMMRGGHIDLALMGAYQVSRDGSLANWTLGETGLPPGVGGAMDLAAGARTLWVLMNHVDGKGNPRIVEKLTLPITATGRVTRIYTDLAIIDIVAGELVVRELFSCTPHELQEQSGTSLSFRPGCKRSERDALGLRT